MTPSIHSTLRRLALVAGLAPLTAAASAQSGGTYNLTWSTIDGGGGASSGGTYVVQGTIGQHEAGHHQGGAFALGGGFWSAFFTGAPAACYPNCDGSTTPPVLNVNDFICFQAAFAAGCR